MSRRCVFPVACLVLVVVATFFVPPIEAAPRFWITPTGGAFGTPGVASPNWSAAAGGVGGATAPVAADDANFTLNNTYDVTFSTAVTTAELDVENGNVTFNLAGVTYTVTLGSGTEIGNVVGQTGRLTILDGTLAVDTAGDDVVLANLDSTGFLTIGVNGQLGADPTRPDLVVADEGTGTLTVQSNGEVFAREFTIGNNFGSTGTATVTGPLASMNVSSTITIGDNGAGTMTLAGGADLVSTSSTTIGSLGGSTGTLTITGAGSQWTQSSSMTIGDDGVGTLNVQSGGELATSATTLGSSAGSLGTVNVTGAGSEWTPFNLTIGSSGEGLLNITGGGQVAVTQVVSIGHAAGSQAAVTVSGAGSRLDEGSGMTIANGGVGSLTISAGGQVTSAGGASIGLNSAGVGEVTVTGAGSSWSLSSFGVLSVAFSGAGTLTVENGGALNVNTLNINDPAGAPVGRVNFHGGTISIEDFSRAAGATLIWTDGTMSIVGGTYNNAGAALTLNGADADDRPTLRLTTGSVTGAVHIGALTVGNNRGAALEVTGGSQLQVPSISIGAADGGDGVVTVSGNFSSLAATTGNINVGGTATVAGGIGTLNIETGAQVDTPNAGQLRLYAGGTVNINGGTLRYGSLNFQGGKVNFNSGLIIQFNNLTADDITLTALLGTSHELGAGRILSTGGTATVSANLDINGGRLEANFLDVQSVAGDSTIFRIRGGGVADFDSGVGLGLFTDVRTYIDDGTLIAGTHIDQFGELHLSGTARVSAGMPLNNQGLIAGSGRIDASLDNGPTGEVRIAAGERIVLNSSTHDNDGLIDVNGGELEMASGPVANSTAGPSTGLIAARNATLRFGGGLTNNGAMTFTSGVSEVFGDVTNTNALATPGRIVVSGGAQANFYDDVTNSGTIQVSAAGSLASTAVFLGSFSGNGVSGGGQVFLEGDVRPGFSPGTMAFGGDVSFGPLAELKIELAGTVPGGQFDRVIIADTLALAGELDVVLINGFNPVLNDSFEIITAAGGVSGEFTTLPEELPDLSSGLEWDIIYGANNIVLQVVAAGLPGDYNNDGTVDAADYVVWRKFEGTNATLPNDPHGGMIGALQFNSWRANFGTTAGNGSLSDASVPEPASTWLLIFGAVIGVWNGRRIASRAP